MNHNNIPQQITQTKDFNSHLNEAQLQAVESINGATLVIAGAGSGKTRTIVYRLAHLLNSGVSPSNILLLTFTRKASHEMLQRATKLLNETTSNIIYPENDLSASENNNYYYHKENSPHTSLINLQGGTFHSFAFSVLRQYYPSGYATPPNILDSSDSSGIIHDCKDNLKIAKGEKSFPKSQTVLSLFSKARNKELSLDEVIKRELYHLLPYSDDLEQLYQAYKSFKRQHAVMDYDDLLFELERLFTERPDLLTSYQNRFQYIMVDEYQDTNLVQCRLVRLLAGEKGNIMAVGDDAQSIYAFRGANVKNILAFTEHFPQAKIIKLEENYRSTQSILNLCNSVLDHAVESYKKHLFTKRENKQKPQVIRPFSDLTQAKLVASRIVELMGRYEPNEIAVLFRSGYHSYHLELELNKRGVRFRKYGGIRYIEAQHIKDVMSYARLLVNPLDFNAFQRVTSLSKGIGPKTCLKLYNAMQNHDDQEVSKICKKAPTLAADLKIIEKLRISNPSPSYIIDELTEHYKPYLTSNFPDDHPRRLQGLEELGHIAATYTELDLFIADLCLEDPFNSNQQEDTEKITLSTIHSAKGLEWSAVLIIDLAEDRFPSKKSLLKIEDFEEERRLMYVACTRAKDELYLFSPLSLYDRATGGTNQVQPSPFIKELKTELYEEWQENYIGGLTQKSAGVNQTQTYKPERLSQTKWNSEYDIDPTITITPANNPPIPSTVEQNTNTTQAKDPRSLGLCTHRIFGRGKIIEELPPDKYKVNFPGIGVKVILSDYLKIDD
ncbi:ATP-dependent helicase [Desulfovibrio litoralis]|uniref:DNA 3'-5' helicase n=1 Tax=Desulfovibrio litoralis DSM 11393 TaxID=1121455 RepID=A0A1M7SYV1_9BACT|nr:ATP-dependent helicase [Desulfovibrio litoralis]SHN63574.1 DNA helicase-2 / ATP-dependent DNA helicase PcrA [Desulfovibrio litoralis DSM 11393]